MINCLRNLWWIQTWWRKQSKKVVTTQHALFKVTTWCIQFIHTPLVAPIWKNVIRQKKCLICFLLCDVMWWVSAMEKKSVNCKKKLQVRWKYNVVFYNITMINGFMWKVSSFSDKSHSSCISILIQHVRTMLRNTWNRYW